VVLVWAKVALEIKHTAGQPCLTMLFDYISEQGTAPALWIVEVPSAMCEGDTEYFRGRRLLERLESGECIEKSQIST
jgi:hypothetical protein